MPCVRLEFVDESDSRLAFVATTIMAALHIRNTGRHNPHHDPNMEVRQVGV